MTRFHSQDNRQAMSDYRRGNAHGVCWLSFMTDRLGSVLILLAITVSKLSSIRSRDLRKVCPPQVHSFDPVMHLRLRE
jgi:hypothetical protein